MKQPVYPLLIVASSLCVFIADRILKHMALSGITFGPSQGGVRFELFPNPAIAFSIAFPTTLTLIVVPIIIAVFVYPAVRLVRTRDFVKSALVISVVIGAFSNYFDRIKYGYVVDYASAGNWFPVFNLSDVAIVVALVLVVTLPAVDIKRS